MATDEFRLMVLKFGEELRRKPYSEIADLIDEPTRVVSINKRHGTINLIVENKEDGALRVVVQGFLDGKWIKRIKNVALDGFYILPNGQINKMPENEFYEFD